jgi:hypothetical protein
MTIAYDPRDEGPQASSQSRESEGTPPRTPEKPHSSRGLAIDEPQGVEAGWAKVSPAARNRSVYCRLLLSRKSANCRT